MKVSDQIRLDQFLSWLKRTRPERFIMIIIVIYIFEYSKSIMKYIKLSIHDHPFRFRNRIITTHLKFMRFMKSSSYDSCVIEMKYESLRWRSKVVFNFLWNILYLDPSNLMIIFCLYMTIFFRFRNWNYNHFNFTHVSDKVEIIICSFHILSTKNFRHIIVNDTYYKNCVAS